MYITILFPRSESLKDRLAKDYRNVAFSCLSGAHSDAGDVGVSLANGDGTQAQTQDDTKRIHAGAIQVSRCHVHSHLYLHFKLCASDIFTGLSITLSLVLS